MTLVGMYAETSPAWVSMIGSAVSEPPECGSLTISSSAAFGCALSAFSAACLRLVLADVDLAVDALELGVAAGTSCPSSRRT